MTIPDDMKKFLLNTTTVPQFHNNVSFNLCALNLNEHNVMLIVVFTLIFCLSVIGNCFVIVTIVQQRWMRTVTNFYLLNLAISDLLLSVICMPPTLISLLVKCFLFSEFMCKALSYLQPVSVTASAYTLAVIALERYFAICRPLHSRHWQTRAHAAKMIAIVWAISFISNFSALIINKREVLRNGVYNCRSAFGLSPYFLLGHQIVLTIALFVLPLCLMVILYGLVIRTLWLGMQLEMAGSETINGKNEAQPDNDTIYSESSVKRRGHQFLNAIRKNLRKRWFSTDRQISIDAPKILIQDASPERGNGVVVVSQGGSGVIETVDYRDRRNSNSSRRPSNTADMALRSTHTEKNLLAKKRVIKMLLTVVVIFFLCWTPLYTFFLIMSIATAIGRQFWSYKAFITFEIAAYLSSVTNPITYCFLNRKFRQAFLLAFGCRELASRDTEFFRAANTATQTGVQSTVKTLVSHEGSVGRKSSKNRAALKLSVVQERGQNVPLSKSIAIRKLESNLQNHNDDKDTEKTNCISHCESPSDKISIYDNLTEATSPVGLRTRANGRDKINLRLPGDEVPLAGTEESNF